MKVRDTKRILLIRRKECREIDKNVLFNRVKKL